MFMGWTKLLGVHGALEGHEEKVPGSGHHLYLALVSHSQTA